MELRNRSYGRSERRAAAGETTYPVRFAAYRKRLRLFALREKTLDTVPESSRLWKRTFSDRFSDTLYRLDELGKITYTLYKETASHSQS